MIVDTCLTLPRENKTVSGLSLSPYRTSWSNPVDYFPGHTRSLPYLPIPTVSNNHQHYCYGRGQQQRQQQPVATRIRPSIKTKTSPAEGGGEKRTIPLAPHLPRNRALIRLAGPHHFVVVVGHHCRCEKSSDQVERKRKQRNCVGCGAACPFGLHSPLSPSHQARE